MPIPAVPSFVAPPSNIAGSSNQIGTVTITDLAGNVIKMERVVINSPTVDAVAAVDILGGLSVNLATDSLGASESTKIRQMLESILLELQTLNANFIAANPGQQYISPKDTAEVTQ
jgi:cob(I)alamin adenosyltransferase